MSERELWTLWEIKFEGTRPEGLSNEKAMEAVVLSYGLQRVKEKLRELRSG